jgi:hypothetical protein
MSGVSSGSEDYRQWPSTGAEVGGRVLDAPKLRVFTLAELRAVTRGFKPEMVLGEGGFGRVYKGWADERSLDVPGQELRRRRRRLQEAQPQEHPGPPGMAGASSIHPLLAQLELIQS